MLSVSVEIKNKTPSAYDPIVWKYHVKYQYSLHSVEISRWISCIQQILPVYKISLLLMCNYHHLHAVQSSLQKCFLKEAGTFITAL